jgi:hypothetical protein
MSIQHANLGVVKKDLQLYYNREFIKSFRGEATTNIVSNTTDFSGLSYAGYSTEWTSDPTRFTKSYNSALQTPIGTGATLLTESGTGGYHHLSRFGGGETGGHSISCYVYPVNGNITNFTVGMLGDGASTAIFNLVTGTVVSTGVRVSNAFITKVSGWLGWYRVGANIGGRIGGWVGAVGLDVQTSYTPSLPYKSMYVTGMQYEYKTYCTPFVVASNRSANTVAGGGGLLDISGNNINADLSNVSFDSNGYYFDGSASYINLGTSKTSLNISSDLTVEAVIKLTSNFTLNPTIIGNGYWQEVYPYKLQFEYNSNNGNLGLFRYDGTNYRYALWNFGSQNTYFLNKTVHIAATYSSLNNTFAIYYNGVSQTITSSNPGNISVNNTTNFAIGAQIKTDGTKGDYFPGTINLVRVYNRALTSSEVLQNFNATRTTYGL